LCARTRVGLSVSVPGHHKQRAGGEEKKLRVPHYLHKIPSGQD
jgi:hypothetical protein